MRVLVFGDDFGVKQILNYLPLNSVVGIVGASIRPQYLDSLKKLANQLNISFLIQPKYKTENYKIFLQQLISLNPNLFLVNSYSMIIREDALIIPQFGGVNIHGSLLPKIRGSNPIQWAILKNEYETGVTIHKIDNGIDTGPIIDQMKVPILFFDTWLDIHSRIKNVTDILIKKNINLILSQKYNIISQDETKATYGIRRTPEDSFFNWHEPIINIYNKIRALVAPLPPAFYFDKSGLKQKIDSYQTIWQLVEKKFCLINEGGEKWNMLIDNIRLRPLLKSDSQLLFKWINNRELVLNSNSYSPVSENDHEKWIENMMIKRSDLVIFVIEDTVTNKSIGICKLININWIHHSAELQIRLGDESLCGKGNGTKAVQLLCQFGFKDLNLHRIHLQVFSSNKREIRCYEKCGFLKEGILKEAAAIDGKRIDAVLMAILKK
jgi:methionyl-tRNA formyltransferase/RimJ/RimL family protein N-acetyltransferase